MPEESILDIVKGAILLEHKGKALYESVVKTSQVEAVREMFSWLVKEEEKHIAFLNKQYRRLAQGDDLDATGFDAGHDKTADAVISEDIVKSVSGAGYEAAVISAALEFEKNAVKYYGEQAESAQSAGQKDVFQWLTKWEVSHMEMLAELDNQLKEQIWFDNQFWPLD